MALPPILSNLPILKLFKSDNAQSAKAESPAPGGGKQVKDTVEISEAALQKLAESKGLSASSLNEARETAVEARDQIATSQVSLGLDPEFS